MSTTKFTLNNLLLFASTPRKIASKATGHYWFPGLLKFSTGELMLNVSLNPDDISNNTNTSEVSLSTDGGATFAALSYDVSGMQSGGGDARICLSDGRIIGTGYQMKPKPLGQYRIFTSHRWSYSDGGRRYQIEPWGATITGLTRDAHLVGGARQWWAQISWFGDIIQDDQRNGRWLSCVSVMYEGDNKWTLLAVGSEDRGVTWTVLATIATPAQAPASPEGFSESSLIQFGSGEIMCVCRVGSGQHMFRSYSTDGGATWTVPDQLGFNDAAPSMLRTSNGVIVLVSRGSTGLEAWFSLDPRGATASFQEFDILGFHNMQATANPGSVGNIANTTGYIGLIEMSPSRLFLVYDRLPRGRINGGDNDGSLGPNEIYLMELGVTRTDGIFQ